NGVPAVLGLQRRFDSRRVARHVADAENSAELADGATDSPPQFAAIEIAPSFSTQARERGFEPGPVPYVVPFWYAPLRHQMPAAGFESLQDGQAAGDRRRRGPVPKAVGYESLAWRHDLRPAQAAPSLPERSDSRHKTGDSNRERTVDILVAAHAAFIFRFVDSAIAALNRAHLEHSLACSLRCDRVGIDHPGMGFSGLAHHGAENVAAEVDRFGFEN